MERRDNPLGAATCLLLSRGNERGELKVGLFPRFGRGARYVGPDATFALINPQYQHSGMVITAPSEVQLIDIGVYDDALKRDARPV